MKFDSTVTISVVLALVATISPMLTALINNRHMLKIKKLDYDNDVLRQDRLRLIEIYEEYLINLGKVIAFESLRTGIDSKIRQEYKSCYLLASLHSDFEIKSLMDKIDNLISDFKVGETTQPLNTLVINLTSQIDFFKNQKYNSDR